MDGQGVSCPFLRFIVHSARTSVPDLLDRLFGQHVQRISVLAATLSPMSTCLNTNERQKKRGQLRSLHSRVELAPSAFVLPPSSLVLVNPRRLFKIGITVDHSREGSLPVVKKIKNSLSVSLLVVPKLDLPSPRLPLFPSPFLLPLPSIPTPSSDHKHSPRQTPAHP